MYGSPFSRASVVAMVVTAVAVSAAVTTRGGSMFSPGALHAGDSTPVMLGGVRSHAETRGGCGSCHAALGSSRPMATRCLACHDDVKDALGDTATLHGALADARACLACHTEHLGPTARLTKIDGFGTAHGVLGFSLAAHQRTASDRAFACEDCHVTNAFRFEGERCESCHRDYQRAFVVRHVADWGRECQSCHDGVDRFSRGRFVHDTTGFVLDGAHTRATCAGCHTDVADLRGYSRAPDSCNGCHAADDAHRGKFGEDCAACHGTSSWEGARVKHEAFPLDHGEGGPIACKTCHEDSRNYKSYTCYNCHEHSRDRVERQHRGEVRSQNLDDCLRCHRDGSGEGEEHEGRRGREREG
jgi:hypothetical protein